MMNRAYIIYGVILVAALAWGNTHGWIWVNSANGTPWHHHHGGSMGYYHK